MIITIHAMNPMTPSNAKAAVASEELVIHPTSIPAPSSIRVRQRIPPNRKLDLRNLSHFQRNSARFRLVSTTVNRKFILLPARPVSAHLPPGRIPLISLNTVSSHNTVIPAKTIHHHHGCCKTPDKLIFDREVAAAGCAVSVGMLRRHAFRASGDST
jgi:hypothetical protein